MVDERASVLVLDDEKNIVTVLKAILEKRDFHVEGFTDPKEALDALRSHRFDATVTDLYMPQIDGMAFLEEVKRLYPGLPVVMITAFGTVDSAVDAIKKGAFDYVTKPFEQSEIVSVVQKAVNAGRLRRLSADRPALSDNRSLMLLGGAKKILENLQKVAPTSSTVLIVGESGSGKEILAEEIHRQSDRAFQPLLKLNCAAISSLGLEAEIFGGPKPGRLELSHRGTLFLDEISEANAEVQDRLLDYLENGSFELTSTKERKKVDVRLIVSSRKDLALEVKEGGFREDLYYKLNVAAFHLPPLRERKEDLPGLVDFLLNRISEKLNRKPVGIHPSVLETFSQVSWPGNLRQLETVLERMILLMDGNELLEKHLSPEIRQEIDQGIFLEGSSFREIVKRQTQNLEKDLIEKALEEMEGNVTRTAEHLGISRKGLQIKIKELGIRQS